MRFHNDLIADGIMGMLVLDFRFMHIQMHWFEFVLMLTSLAQSNVSLYIVFNTDTLYVVYRKLLNLLQMNEIIT